MFGYFGVNHSSRDTDCTARETYVVKAPMPESENSEVGSCLEAAGVAGHGDCTIGNQNSGLTSPSQPLHTLAPPSLRAPPAGA
jgi:hypothetical protein